MNGGYNFALGKLTSPTSAPSNYTTNSVWHTYPPLSWWQFAYDGVNYTLSFSTNGYVFTPVYVVAATDFIGQAVATGIFVDNQDGGAYTNSADQTIELWSEVSSNP
jgi:hypothetical protein